SPLEPAARQATATAGCARDFCAICSSRQDPPGAARCKPSVPHLDLAVDKDMDHALGELIRLLQCAALAKGVRVEDGDIRPIPDPQHSAIGQFQALRGL